MAFWGATVFFAAAGPCNELRKKKKVSTKKTSKISKKSSPRASDTGKGSYKHNAPDLWGRGSTWYIIINLLIFYYVRSKCFCYIFVWCPCMAINVSVQYLYNMGLLPSIILLTQCYYHRGTRLNAVKRLCICSL